MPVFYEFGASRCAELVEDWHMAAQAYRAILRRQPEDVSAIVNLGNCHYQLGEYAVSIEVYRAAVQVRSDCSEAWYNLDYTRLLSSQI